MTTAAITTKPATLNTTNITWMQDLQFFCLSPGFCGSETRKFCSNIPISQCPNCSLGSGVFFLVLAFILFVVVIFGNASIQACFFSTASMRTKMDYVRLSLSVSDMLTGFQIIIVLIPNLIRTFGMTQTQLDEFTFLSISDPTTIICGCWFNLSFTSSMYHVVLLSAFRLMAVTHPLKYRLLSNRWVYICIAVAWSFAIYTASVPTFPGTPVIYIYFQSAFTFLPVEPYLEQKAGPNMVMIFSIMFPYACVMVIIPMTVIILRVKRKKSEAILNQNPNNSQSYQQEMRIVCTLAIMYFSYAASVLPLLIVLVLIGQGSLSCSSMGTSTMLTVFFAMGNSLVNVIVYAARDERFRKGLYQLLREKCPTDFCPQKKRNSNLNTITGVANRTEDHTAL